MNKKSIFCSGSDIRAVQHVRQSIPRVDVGPPQVLPPKNGGQVLAGNNRQNAPYSVERHQTASNLVDTQNIVNNKVYKVRNRLKTLNRFLKDVNFPDAYKWLTRCCLCGIRMKSASF